MRADEPHPDVQEILDRVAAADVMPLARYGDAETAREVAAEMRADADGPPLHGVEDRTVPGPAGEIPVRVYHPDGDDSPTVLYFHGGGWVIGDLESHDLACRHLADATGCTVVAVDYRRAPEDPYPAALADCYAVTEWVAADPGAVGGDGRLAVAGDSAGGNLAAAVCLRARDEGVAYAERLREVGIPVTHHHYPAMIHAFLTMLAPPAELEAAHDAVEQVAADLRRNLGVESHASTSREA